DEAGRLKTRTDGNGHTTEFGYDILSELISSKDPLTHVTSFEYDALGQVSKRSDPLGHSATFTYDNMERVTGIAYTGGRSESHLTFTARQNAEPGVCASTPKAESPRRITAADPASGR